jgi:hypothetical protein
MKYLLKLIFITFCAGVSGQELQPIKNILERGIRSDDDVQISYVLKRCVALNLVMGNWMKDKGGERMKSSVSKFLDEALLLQEFSFELENKIETARKIKVSTRQELEKALLLNIKVISPLYVERLAKNYAASGSYFEKDRQLTEEIGICSNFQKHLDALK